MLTMVTERPAHPSGAHAVYCERCRARGRTLAPLALIWPGIFQSRIKQHEYTVTGLTPQQRVWVKCPCGHSQEVKVPQS
jgi:hypothetical protein